MKFVRRWLSRGVISVLLVFSALGCAGKSKSSAHDDASDDGRGGNATGGSARGGTSAAGTSSGGVGGTAPCSESNPASCAGNQVCLSGECVTPIVLEDPNNYIVTISYSIPTVDTAPGADLTICWDDVETDLSCSAVNPETDIAAVELLRSRGPSTEEIAEMLASGTLNMSSFDGFLQYDTDRQSTCAQLSSLTNFGTPVDVAEEYVEDPERSYLLMVNRETAPGQGIVSMVFARPVASSMNRRIDLPPGCDIVEFEADLQSAEPVRFSYDTPWLVHYGNLTRDGLGNELFLADLDVLVLSFFAGATLSELEVHALDLDAVATESFEVALTGTPMASLYEARSRESGEPFAGFERPESGIWLLRLMCSTCTTLTPEVIVVLEPF